MTDEERELLASLSRLNVAFTTFSMDLLKRSLDQEAHVKLALLLLGVADQVLKHMVEGDGT